MARQVIIAGSATCGKTLSQKLKAMQYLKDSKKIAIVQPKTQPIVLDGEKINEDDMMDAINYAFKQMRLKNE